MFIQTEDTANADRMRFIPGREVLGDGEVTFRNAEEGAGSPLARRLFDIADVRAITLGADDLLVEKAAAAEWHHVKPQVLAAIMEHFMGNDPVLEDPARAAPVADSEADAEIIAQLEELIENRVQPAVSAQGGRSTPRLQGRRRRARGQRAGGRPAGPDRQHDAPLCARGDLGP